MNSETTETKSRLKEVPKDCQIIQILSDNEEQKNVIERITKSQNDDYIETAIISGKIDEMKKAIFRCIINVFPSDKNLDEINKKYVKYFKQAIGINIAKGHFRPRFQPPKNQNIQVNETRIIVHGVDFMSTKNIQNFFKGLLPIKIDWINPSNVSINFQSKEDLENSLGLLRLNLNQNLQSDMVQQENPLKWVPLKKYDILGFQRSLFYRMASKEEDNIQKQLSNDFKKFEEAKNDIQHSQIFINQEQKNFYDQNMRKFQEFLVGSHRRRNNTRSKFGDQKSSNFGGRERSRSNRPHHRSQFSDKESKDHFNYRFDQRHPNGKQSSKYFPYPTDRHNKEHNGQNNSRNRDRRNSQLNRENNHQNDGRKHFNRQGSREQNSFRRDHRENNRRQNRFIEDQKNNCYLIGGQKAKGNRKSRSRSNSSISVQIDTNNRRNMDVENLQDNSKDMSFFLMKNQNINNLSKISSSSKDLSFVIQQGNINMNKDEEESKSLGDVILDLEKNEDKYNKMKSKQRSRSVINSSQSSRKSERNKKNNYSPKNSSVRSGNSPNRQSNLTSRQNQNNNFNDRRSNRNNNGNFNNYNRNSANNRERNNSSRNYNNGQRNYNNPRNYSNGPRNNFNNNTDSNYSQRSNNFRENDNRRDNNFNRNRTPRDENRNNANNQGNYNQKRHQNDQSDRRGRPSRNDWKKEQEPKVVEQIDKEEKDFEY